MTLDEWLETEMIDKDVDTFQYERLKRAWEAATKAEYDRIYTAIKSADANLDII